MKVGISLIRDFNENVNFDIKKLRARLSENWTEIDLNELTSIVDNNTAIMTGKFIGSRECLGMQLFIIEVQDFETYQIIINRCELYNINIAFSYSSKTYNKNEKVYRVVLAHEYLIKNKFVINVVINMIYKIFPENNYTCTKTDHVYNGEENEILKSSLICFNISQLFYPLFESFDKGDSYSRNYKRFCIRNRILMINGNVAMGQLNYLPSILAGNVDPTSIYIEGESQKTAIFMVSSEGQCNNVIIRNETKRIDLEKNCDCKLLQEFYTGKDISDDTLFMIYSNMNNLRGGKSKFYKILENNYCIEKVTKWRNYLLYYKNIFPCDCSGTLCPYFESCDNVGTIVDKLTQDKKITRKEEKLYTLDEASDSLMENLYDAIHSPESGIHLIKAQTAIGKTTTYIDLVFNDQQRKYIIAVPTNKLKDQVFSDLRYEGFRDEEIFMTASISDNILIPLEIKEKIASDHKIGIHNKGKAVISEYYKEIEKNPSKIAVAEECKKIIDSINAVTDQRVIVTTHAFFMNLPEMFLRNYTVIIDEDIMQLSFFNNIHSISQNCLLSIVTSRLPGYSDISREMLNTPLGIYKNLDKCKVTAHFNEELLGDIAFSENDNIFDLIKTRSFVRMEDPNTGEIVVRYFCPCELKPMKYIILSATLNFNIYKKYFQDCMEVFLYPEKKAAYKGKLIQFTYHLLGRRDLAKKMAVFDWLKEYTNNEHLQVITFKGNKLLGDLSESNEFDLHFGNTSGINKMTGMNIGIIGTPFKVEEAYKLIASYLGADVNNKIDEFPRTHRVNYNNSSFLFITYSDLLLREIQLYSIESELEQCVGRARLLRNNCEVYLLSSFPCEQSELHIRDYLKD